MTACLNVQPKILNLALYAGDGLKFQMTCSDKDGAPIPITGTIEAQVRVLPISEDPAIVDFDVNLDDAGIGVIVLSLTGDQTQTLSDHPTSKAGKFIGVWDLEWTPDESEPRTLVKGEVECISDVTR